MGFFHKGGGRQSVCVLTQAEKVSQKVWIGINPLPPAPHCLGNVQIQAEKSALNNWDSSWTIPPFLDNIQIEADFLWDAFLHSWNQGYQGHLDIVTSEADVLKWLFP